MKSMDMSSHGLPGVGKGWSKPYGLWFIGLVVWHMWQLLMKWAISFFICGQKNCAANLLVVALTPECPPNVEE